MKRIASLLVLVGTSTAAFADSEPVTDATAVTANARPRGYVGVGATAGMEQLFVAGVRLDGGVRLGNTPLYLRGLVESGRAATWTDDGTYQTYRLGIEARRCESHTCAFAGLDGGVRRAQLVHDFDSGMSVTDPYNVGLVVPRAGLEVGSRRVRGQLAVELPTAFDRTDSVTGLAMSASVGFVF